MDKIIFLPKRTKLGQLCFLDLEMHATNPTNRLGMACVCIKLYTQLRTFNRYKCKEAADQHIITNPRLRLPITMQTLNKNLEHVMNELTDGSKIKSHLLPKKSSYG